MRKIHKISPEFNNWASSIYDELSLTQENLNIDGYLARRMKEIGAEPVWFDGVLSGMCFPNEEYHTLFILRYSNSF